ncbi:alpha/beta-hydrolase [Aureobasidium pullulans]|uniref:feruloyl esterase n=1 Tax=Aureobasidium pullulans TaxID=5580 RepID=A0AB74JB68_AURPU|nr:alpha/beta-hydrolase [Aureobasidium pullulans]
MKSATLILAALFAGAHAAATPGCGSPLSAQLTRGGADKTNTLSFTTSGGVVRSYLLHIPTSYDVSTPAPIAFSYHGRNGNSKDQETISGMSNEAFNPNYLVVYPQGLNAVWQGDPDASGYDDVGFTLELLANLTSTFCIDSTKIYAAGKSNGGGFSANILACDPQASRVFAAFGGIAGAYYQGNTDYPCDGTTVPVTCNPGRYPVPIFTTHGDSDATIPYTGGGRRGRCLPTIPHFMTEWSVRNGLGSSNTSVSLYNNNVIRYDYGNDSFSQLSTHYLVHGLDHTWPSIAAGSSFDATPLLLAFWNKWTLDTTPYNFVNATASTPIVSSTTSTRTSSTVTPTSSIPSASLCPSVNGQTVTDSTGNMYKVTCSADNSVGSYANAQAASSYLDCMNACDAAASAGCQGFTYVGGANGQNSGTCWLKKSMGTYTGSGSNTISAVRVSGGSSGNSAFTTSFTVSSTASTSSSVSLSAAPVASALSCPASNNQVYTYAGNGAQFVIECGIDHAGGDMASTSVKNLEGCIAACATTAGCVDVSLSGSACYLKKSLGAAVNNGGVLGARFVGTAATSSTSVSTSNLVSTSSSLASSISVVSSSSVAPSISSTSSTQGSTGTIVTSVLASSTSSTSSTSSITVSPSIGTDGYTTTNYPPSCTAINTNIYAVTDGNGKPYLFMCGGGSAGGTASTIGNVANWTACFQACDGYSGCTGFTYNQGAALGNGAGQCLIKTDSPQSFVSTAQLLSTRIAGFIHPITTTTSSSSTSSSATLISSSAVAITSSSVALSSSSFSSLSTTPSMTSFSTSTIPSSSATASSSDASSSSSPSSSSSSTSSSSTSSSTSSATVAVPSSTPIIAPSCPASNGTTYADAGGVQYTILCTYDTSVNTISASSSVGSFGDCAVLCDTTSGCTGLTWNGTFCSLKQSFGQYILGAVKA